MKRTFSGLVFLLVILGGFGNLAMAVVPTITPITVHNTCAGSSGELIYSSTGSPFTYSIVWAGTPTGLPDVPPGTYLPPGGIVNINTFPTCATGSYNGLITVANGSGTSAPVSITINVYGLPTVFAVTGGGSYCAFGTGVHVGLSSSSFGINYQLYISGVAVGGPIAGTGTTLDFGLKTTAGTYTVKGWDPVSGCTRMMSGSADVIVEPNPPLSMVTGGGGFCPGSIGVPVGINYSTFGINYQLFRGATPVGGPMAGIGMPLDFGLQTVGGSYTVTAVNPDHPGCVVTMGGVANAVAWPAPTVHNVTGGGSYCLDGIGVHVGLSLGNTSVMYTLYKDGSFWTNYPGAGTVIDFGLLTHAGAYTVIGTNTYGCKTNMLDTAIVTILAQSHPSVSIIPVSPVVSCSGEPDTFAANVVYPGPSASYQWSVNGFDVAGATDSLFIYSLSTTERDVRVRMTSSAQCPMPAVVTDNILMTPMDRLVPVSHIFPNTPTTITNGETGSFTAISSNAGPKPTYQWFVNGGLVAGAHSETFSSNAFNDKDSISCNVYGCSDTPGKAYIIIHVIPRVGVKQISSSENHLSIFPNPSNGSFTINGNLGLTMGAEGSVHVRITDVVGKTVYTGEIKVNNGSINEMITLPGVVRGIYLLNILTPNGNVVSQIVVE
jgi:Secretion system C-terminal sorting domain